jgi:hypothetical protein
MRPPTLAQALVAAVAPTNDYEIVAGDLHEEYLHILHARGSTAANRWYWAQALLSIPSLLSYSRSNASVLRRVGIALTALAVLVAMLLVLVAIDTVYQALFGSMDRAPNWIWVCVDWADAVIFGAILAWLVRTDSLRVAFCAALFLVLCFVVPALAGNPHSQAPLEAWIVLWAVIPAMCIGAGICQTIRRRADRIH